LIYLIRHGEAAAGWGDELDPGLSDLGKQQAETAAQTLLDLGVTSAIKSPMLRCQETAGAFERLAGITAPIEQAVSEIETPLDLKDRGTWLKGVMSGNWDEAGHDFTPWRTRALDAVTALPDNTAVFSHFIAINAIVGLLENDPRVIVFKPTYCSITQLSRAGDGLAVAQRGAELDTRVL